MVAVDVASLATFFALFLLAMRAKHAFKQSKQALVESASIVSVIVDALSSRLEKTESVVSSVQAEIDALKTHGNGLEWEQASVRSSYLQLLAKMQEMLSNDKRLIDEVEQLKNKLGPIPQRGRPVEPIADRPNLGGVLGQSDILASLTPTERETLDILSHEGPKPAPELGKRLDKSREHTARLMKKLYLEGYVDRESNRAPFRYKLSETARAALEPRDASVTAEASEKA